MSATAPQFRGIGQIDLARLAKVSQKTVSRALGDGNGVRQETRERILMLAARHQYRPNAAARSTRSGRFGAVALLLGTTARRSNLPTELLDGVQDALGQRDLNLMLVRLPDEQLTDDDYVPRILRETASDGLLIDYTHGVPERMRALIEQSMIPAVWINTRQQYDCVRPDDLAGAQAATRLLIERGYRRIGYADFSHARDTSDVHYSAVDRRDGYLDAMVEAGLNPRLLAPALQTVKDGKRVEWALQALSGSERPEAVLCYADTTAAAFYHAAHEMDLRVGRDLALLSFGESASFLLAPPLSTMLVPSRQVGIAAVNMLLEQIESGTPAPAVAVPYTFQEGGTSPPVAQLGGPR